MLKAGQVLHDNNPRYRGRKVETTLELTGGGEGKVEVLRIEGSYAVCKSGPRQVKVRLDYISSDGMPKRSGYSTVAPTIALAPLSSLSQTHDQ